MEKTNTPSGLELDTIKELLKSYRIDQEQKYRTAIRDTGDQPEECLKALAEMCMAQEDATICDLDLTKYITQEFDFGTMRGHAVGATTNPKELTSITLLMFLQQMIIMEQSHAKDLERQLERKDQEFEDFQELMLGFYGIEMDIDEGEEPIIVSKSEWENYKPSEEDD